TKTPARIAAVRVAIAAAVGAVLMLQFEPVALGPIALPAGLLVDAAAGGLPLGPVGLALGAAVAAWTEWLLLRGRLERRLGGVGVSFGALGRIVGAALAAAAAGYAVRLPLADVHPLAAAVAVAAGFGV